MEETIDRYDDREKILTKLASQRITTNYSYPNDKEYEYFAQIERIDFDQEYARDLQNGKGFIISTPKATIKKDIKDENGIFSPKFGQKLGDLNPFIDRYSCSCGFLKSKIHEGMECPECHTLCKYVDDDFKIFGWFRLVPEYPIIHPDIYVNLDSLFGKSKYDKRSRNKNKGSKLRNILDYDTGIDLNGHEIETTISKTDEPFFGKGFLYFINHFDEILEYYHQKNINNEKKELLYQDIIQDRNKVFIHSIPVFTSHLRPMDISSGSMYYEKCTAIYNMMGKLVHKVNRNKTKFDRTPKQKCDQLFSLQMKYMELYNEIIAILKGKRGQLRMLVSGRYNFSSRCVIRQDPSLHIDEIKLPYAELVITQKAQIENILHRMYNISFQQAYDIWYDAISEVNPIVVQILETLISNGEKDPKTGVNRGLPVLVNRNPTISYGSILQCFCVGINYDYTMSTPLQILKSLAADYDGDVLNILHLINHAFYERAYQIFNPRNAMYISRSNGFLSKDVLVQRDTLINANTLESLTNKKYTKEEIEKFTQLSKNSTIKA